MTKKYAHNFKDLTGKRRGKWTIIKRIDKTKRRCPYWLCRCDCGIEKEVSGNSLRSGSKSCLFCRKTRGKLLTPTEKKTSTIRARYRIEAKQRNLIFDLSQTDFNRIIQLPCFYCDSIGKNRQIMNNGDYFEYNGIDRVDNNKGYTLENCVACCKECNVHKKSITPEMIRRAYNFLFGKKDV